MALLKFQISKKMMRTLQLLKTLKVNTIHKILKQKQVTHHFNIQMKVKMMKKMCIQWKKLWLTVVLEVEEGSSTK